MVKKKAKSATRRKAVKKPHPAQKKTDAQIATALRNAKGLLTFAARKLGMTDRAVRYRVAASPELRETLQDARESNIDDAEDALLKSIRKREPWAVKFYLACQGKHRGYVTRQEVDVHGDIEHNVTVNIREVADELQADPTFVDFCRANTTDHHAGLLCDGGVNPAVATG